MKIQAGGVGGNQWLATLGLKVDTGRTECNHEAQVQTETVPTPSWIFPLGCGTSKGEGVSLSAWLQTPRCVVLVGALEETSNKNVTVFFYIVVITDVF